MFKVEAVIQSARIRGVLASVVTPFKNDLAPDSQRLIAHCKLLLSQNCGLAVFGTNSEANSLSLEERAMPLDELVAAGVDPSRMMPGTGCCSELQLLGASSSLSFASSCSTPPYNCVDLIVLETSVIYIRSLGGE